MDTSVSKQFSPRVHDHVQKMQTTVQMQTQTSASTFTSKDEFEWYISHYQALQTAMNANINANANANINANSNATVEDASTSLERQFLSSIMTGREVTYLHNYLQILSQSRSQSQSQDTGKRNSLRLSVLQFMSQLFEPMRYTNTHTGTHTRTGNSAGECTSTSTSSSIHLHSLVTLSGLAAKGMNLTHMLNGLSDTKAEIIDLLLMRYLQGLLI